MILTHFTLTRVEVISPSGRVLVCQHCGAEARLQDDDGTLKVFIDREPDWTAGAQAPPTSAQVGALRELISDWRAKGALRGRDGRLQSHYDARADELEAAIARVSAPGAAQPTRAQVEALPRYRAGLSVDAQWVRLDDVLALYGPDAPTTGGEEPTC